MLNTQKPHPVLAVIMSLYRGDRLDYVKLAVESLLNQTYKAFDLYIKTDGIVAVDVEAYLRSLSDERVNISARSVNKGLAYSLNELLREVKVLLTTLCGSRVLPTLVVGKSVDVHVHIGILLQYIVGKLAQ